MTIKYEAGQKYNRLTIESIFKKHGSHGRHAVCVCECGNSKEVQLGSLGNGHTKSCGCLHKEIMSKINKTHGMSAEKIYSVWEGMIQRCTNNKSTNYKNYGARGITVCDDWKDFNKFYSDMGNVPKGKTLDRMNNDNGYSKDNCEWSTWEKQHSNKRIRKDNKTGVQGVEFWGKRYRVRVFSKHLGIFDNFKEACNVANTARQRVA